MADGGKLHDRKIGSVRAAVDSYGNRIQESRPAEKKFQSNFPEKSYSRRKELHQAKRDTNEFNESRELAESVKAEAESKLSAAKKTVKDLALRIEESNLIANAQMQGLEKMKLAKTTEGDWSSEYLQYERVLRELESIKRELSKLKLDMASVMEEKGKAEKEAESSLSKTRSYSSSVEGLNKQVEEINEEHVLVELARIEAIKEYGEIEAQRREEAGKYQDLIEEAKKKKQDVIEEIEDAEEMETKLAITESDINMLQNEINQFKEIDKGQGKNDVVKELEATKKELASVKDERFQFMSSMDVVRNEIIHVGEEIARLKKKEEKSEMTMQNLNSKLLRAKDKLESASAAEDKAKSIVANLTQTLEQIQSEAETAKTERSLISEETEVIKAEIQQIETEIDSAEERLQSALQELKEVKSSEAVALENLKALIENTVRNRASASRATPKITISKFEYEYLTGHAVGAKEIADKKVAAALAWIEALKASEKEIMIKYELLRRETRELQVEEEREVNKTEMKPEMGLDGKDTIKSGKMTPIRSISSPAVRGNGRSTSFTVRRRKKMMPNLAKFLSGRSLERNV